MSSTTPPLLELEDVSHQPGEGFRLDSVNWTVNPGDRWALLGPSGAGKTTLLRLACGREWPNRGGTIRRQGKTQRNLREWWNRVGWLSQDLLERIPGRQSVRDTVLTGVYSQSRLALRRGRDLDEEHRLEARSWLGRLGLNDRGNDAFESLSQGERQLVLVARALMADPLLVVLDEPCAGLDPGGRERFLGQLNGLLREDTNRAFLYVTHQIQEILPGVERVLALRGGRVLARGPRQEVLTEEILGELYGVPHRLHRDGGRVWPVIPDTPPS